MKLISEQIFEALKALSTPEKANFLPRFFKTGKGEYAEGDQFLGVVVPDSRKIAKHFAPKLQLDDIQEIIRSPFHEMRFVALLILIQKFEKSKSETEKLSIINFYLANTPSINNWDLVDVSCYKILGRYCFENANPQILMQLSKSDNMWEKRIAIVSTMYYCKKGKTELTYQLALRNLKHPHDLMHKANGWLLREAGKSDQNKLILFLRKYYTEIPRTTLRYAIEKFSPKEKSLILAGQF